MDTCIYTGYGYPMTATSKTTKPRMTKLDKIETAVAAVKGTEILALDFLKDSLILAINGVEVAEAHKVGPNWAVNLKVTGRAKFLGLAPGEGIARATLAKVAAAVLKTASEL